MLSSRKDPSGCELLLSSRALKSKRFPVSARAGFLATHGGDLMLAGEPIAADGFNFVVGLTRTGGGGFFADGALVCLREAMSWLG